MPDTSAVVGAEATFEQLYRRYAGRVRGYALRRSDASTADDVVADVFLVAWRRIEDLPADPLPWLYGTARKVLANRRRGEQRAHALRHRLGDQPRPRSSDPTSGALDRRVADALGELGERDQELLMLIAWEGLSVAEAAVVLNARPGTVAVRLHRARERFARALSAHDAPLKPTSEVSS